MHLQLDTNVCTSMIIVVCNTVCPRGLHHVRLLYKIFTDSLPPTHIPNVCLLHVDLLKHSIGFLNGLDFQNNRRGENCSQVVCMFCDLNEGLWTTYNILLSSVR